MVWLERQIITRPSGVKTLQTPNKPLGSKDEFEIVEGLNE